MNGKNLNCRYACVEGIVFPSYFAAREYCKRMNLNPDTIAFDNPQALELCKDIIVDALPALEHTLQILDDMIEVADKAHAVLVQQMNAPGVLPPASHKELYLGYVKEAAGRHSGLIDARKKVSDQIIAYRRIRDMELICTERRV